MYLDMKSTTRCNCVSGRTNLHLIFVFSLQLLPFAGCSNDFAAKAILYLLKLMCIVKYLSQYDKPVLYDLLLLLEMLEH